MATAMAHHYATVNPYTGEVVREFESLDAAAVDRAVETANQAFSAWRDRPIEERAAIVHRAGNLLAEQRDRLAALVTLEMGKRIVEARAAIVRRAGGDAAEFANRKLICAVAPDAPVGGFAG